MIVRIPSSASLVSRLLLGTLVGAVLGSGWWLLFNPDPPLPLRLLGPDGGSCSGDIGECLGPFARNMVLFVVLFAGLVLAHFLLGWGLLALFGVRPAWLVALLGFVATGIVGAVVLGVAGTLPLWIALRTVSTMSWAETSMGIVSMGSVSLQLRVVSMRAPQCVGITKAA